MTDTTDSTTDSTTETDGRRLRRSRNREAAVEALLALYRDGRLDPSAADIAERAGLSPRSLFRYFDDVDDLVRAAIERQTQIVFPALERRADDSLDTPERIEQFVDLRLALFDTMGKVGRVTRLHAPFHDEIRSNLAVMRTYLRRQVELTFAAELGRVDATDRRATIAALDVMCSYESVDLLLDDQGLSHAQTRATLVRGVTALLRAD